MSQVGISRSAADFRPVHPVAVVGKFHNGRGFNGFRKSGPTTFAFEFVGRRKQGFPGNHIHIDAFFKLIPEFIHKGTFRVIFLGDAVLFICQFVTNRFGGGFLVIAWVNSQLGKKLDLFPGNMTIAGRSLFQKILMVFFGGGNNSSTGQSPQRIL